jgi:hypothetical protein
MAYSNHYEAQIKSLSMQILSKVPPPKTHHGYTPLHIIRQFFCFFTFFVIILNFQCFKQIIFEKIHIFKINLIIAEPEKVLQDAG